MADKKFEDFTDGGEMQVGDVPVGLRLSDLTKNFKWDFPGIGIKDSNGNWLFQYATAGAAAVNFLKLINAVASSAAQLTADGSDANIDIEIVPKGTGVLFLDGLQWPASDGAPFELIATNGASVLDFVSIQAGTGITVSKVGSTITISGSGSGYTWTEITGTSQNMSVNNGYIANNAGLVTLTLPSTGSVGDTVIVQGKGAGLYRIAQNAGQTIHFGASDTTTGVAGYIEATQRYDSIELVCITANTDWAVLTGPQGSLTVV